jgi:aspartyl-tRNA(Asn)/glutamyl-tRNA(Gln) amidotransferase subunit A
LAADIGAAEYLDAQRFRQELANRLLAHMVELDLAALAMPSTLVTAPPRADAEQYFTLLSRNAIPWSLIGWPAMTVPCAVGSGCLPVGLQLVAPPCEDGTLMRLGSALEQRAQ